jgi:hypothetical protein
MKGAARKAAIAAYKERKVVGGVYVVRCEASGERWVGQWPDIDTIQTRVWFTLRQGTNPNRDLLEAWRQHGEAGFSFEVLERYEEEASPSMRTAHLRERASHWRKELGANSI